AAVAVSDTREELESDAVPISASALRVGVRIYCFTARPNIYPAPSPPPSPRGLGMAKFLHPPRHPPPRPRRCPTPNSQSIHPASSSSSALPPSSPSAPASHSDGWAIWSRRPRDPAHAPSVMVSPRARPPPNVMASARAGGTPPTSPPAGAGGARGSSWGGSGEYLGGRESRREDGGGGRPT
ncbi:hypothetical protein B0H14DRAFT_3688262, partial [Mycena olivaceomarginata]